MKIGNQPVNIQPQFFCNAKYPTGESSVGHAATNRTTLSQNKQAGGKGDAGEKAAAVGSTDTAAEEVIRGTCLAANISQSDFQRRY